MRIPRNFYLGRIFELEYPNAFTVEATELADLALRQPKSHHKASWFRKLVTAYAAAASTVLSPVPLSLASPNASVSNHKALSHTDTKLQAGALLLPLLSQLPPRVRAFLLGIVAVHVFDS